jgi:hydrogenase nickel incorporation protein HypB
MCTDCGCGEALEHHHHDHEHDHDHEHSHDHEHDGHTHSHDHDHKHSHKHNHDHEHSRTLTIEKNVLSHNQDIANENRKWLAEKGVMCVNIISSPGSGKTTLLEKTLEALNGLLKCAVIVGDQQTDNDAKRLEGKGAKVMQIETYTLCHLNAEQIQKALPEFVEDDTKLLFIENVGNLVCPAAFDLGENFKIALLSTTEGEDKAVKYPVLFSGSQIVVLTKTDLVPHLDWDMAECRKNIRKIHPGVFIFELSAKTGEGMTAWIDYLKNLA